MSGKLITPRGAEAEAELPPEFNVSVLVNGNPTPYPLAVLAVQSDVAKSLTRIAEALERAYPESPSVAALTNSVAVPAP